MTVWSVKTDGKNICFGTVRRRMVSRNGCNEPFKGAYWCPKKKWFQKEPCPFASKLECQSWQRMAGSL